MGRPGRRDAENGAKIGMEHTTWRVAHGARNGHSLRPQYRMPVPLTPSNYSIHVYAAASNYSMSVHSRQRYFGRSVAI